MSKEEQSYMNILNRFRKTFINLNIQIHYKNSHESEYRGNISEHNKATDKPTLSPILYSNGEKLNSY